MKNQNIILVYIKMLATYLIFYYDPRYSFIQKNYVTAYSFQQALEINRHLNVTKILLLSFFQSN